MSGKKNILVITYWSFKDPLIQAYTLPYIQIIQKKIPEGSKIFLVTLEQVHLKMTASERAGVVEQLRQQNIYLIDINYRKFNLIFFLVWMIFLIRLLSIIFIRNIKFIHAWCTPAGAFAYILSKISARPLTIDSYEPHAETMVENKTWKKNGLKFQSLFYFEKKLSQHANVIVSATSGMRYYANEKYQCVFKTFFVKPACVRSNFNLNDKKRNDELEEKLKLKDKIVCVYAGKFGGIYLDKEVFCFLKIAEDYWRGKFKLLLLTSHNKLELLEWARFSGFNTEDMIITFVDHANIPHYIGLADFAITPVKPIPTKRFCTPIKNGEYWAMGLPIVITKNISDDSEIIEKNNIGAVIRKLSVGGYEDAIKKIDELIFKNAEINLSEKIQQIAIKYRDYAIAEKVYHSIYQK